jgi:gamma-glutamyl-gamma-aminobutyrate hydrolase PuuD
LRKSSNSRGTGQKCQLSPWKFPFQKLKDKALLHFFESQTSSSTSHPHFPGDLMKPIVGIAVDIELAPKNGRLFSKCYQSYIDSVYRAGGFPQLIAPIEDDEYIRHIADSIDALVIPGGDDIDVREMGVDLHDCSRFIPVTKERFQFDRKLVREILLRRVPCLAVCYGAQLVNLMLGGEIIQDIPDMLPGAIPHKSSSTDSDQVHGLIIEPKTRLHNIFKASGGSVNSVHHQAIKTAGEGLKVTARAPDGVIEAIEAIDPRHYMIGVQWHPERCPFEEGGIKMFKDLVREAYNYHTRRTGSFSITGTDTL